MSWIPSYIRRLRRNAAKAFSVINTVQIQTIESGTFSFVFRGTNTSIINIDWNDGSALEEITLLGSGTDVNVNHVYTDASTKIIKITKNITNITHLTASSNSITSTLSFVQPMSSLTYLDLSDNSITGDLHELISFPAFDVLDLSDNNLTYNGAGLPAWSGTSYNFRSSLFEYSYIDNIINDAVTAGINNCTLYLDDENASRSLDSDASLLLLLFAYKFFDL